MNIRLVAGILGRVLLIEAAMLLLPALCAILFHESIMPFLLTALALAAVGGALCCVRSPSKNLFAREGFVCVGASWVLMSLFGAIPFVISGDIPNLIDALFETVSGFTTTGATVLTNVEGLSRGCMFWRLFTHWIGGMGVLVFVMAVLPDLGARDMYIMRAEMPGPTVSKLVPRARKTARILYLIYIALTVVETIFLLLGGMSFYEALLHAFATAGTGGFSTRNASIAAFDSIYLETVITVFMLLFSVNFNLYYLLLMGQLRSALRSEELRVFFGIVFAAALLISWWIAPQVGGFAAGLRYAFFQVASIVSTTGFSTTDYNSWPEFCKWILILLMFLGGCVGSTAGGLKVSRVIILLKSYLYELKNQITPSRVFRIWFEKRPIEENTVKSVQIYFLAYLLMLFAGGLIVSLDNWDFTTSLTAVLACLSNVGPGLSAVGPTGNFSIFSALSKLVLILEMLLGRLEIFPVVYLFSPIIWRRYRR